MTNANPTYQIKYSHGLTVYAANAEEAVAALESVYGKDIVGGDAYYSLLSELEGCTPEETVLVWRDEASAADDDGSNAVARVSLCFEVSEVSEVAR